MVGPARQQPFMQFFDEDIQDQLHGPLVLLFPITSCMHSLLGCVSYALAEPTDIDEPSTHAEAVKSIAESERFGAVTAALDNKII